MRCGELYLYAQVVRSARSSRGAVVRCMRCGVLQRCIVTREITAECVLGMQETLHAQSMHTRRCKRWYLRSNNVNVHWESERVRRCERSVERIACQPHRIIRALMSSKPHAKQGIELLCR